MEIGPVLEANDDGVRVNQIDGREWFDWEVIEVSK